MKIEIQRNEENFKLPKKIEDKGQKKNLRQLKTTFSFIFA